MTVIAKRFLSSRVLCRIFLSVFWLGLTVLSAPGQAQDDLSRFQNMNRILLIFAPKVSDPDWRRQAGLLAKSNAPFRERDLLRFDIFELGESRGPDGKLAPHAATRLRERYRVKAGRFRVLLIGKDGHVAFGDSVPISLQDVTGRIDQMPMRREEMRRRHESGDAR